MFLILTTLLVRVKLIITLYTGYLATIELFAILREYKRQDDSQ